MKPFKLLRKKVNGYYAIVDLADKSGMDRESDLEPVFLCCTKGYAEMLIEWLNEAAENLP